MMSVLAPRLRLGLATFSAFLLGAGLILFLHTHGKVLRIHWLLYLLWWLPVVVAVALFRAPPKAGRRARARLAAAWPALALCIGMVLFLFSSIMDHLRFFMNHWLPHEPEPFGVLLPRFVFFAALFFPLLLVWKKKWLWILIFGALIVAQVYAAHRLFEQTHGLPIYRDDHPSFLYRLHEFKTTFPRMVNYDPHWNGGTLHYVGMTSGIYSLGLLLWPLWHFFPVEKVYTMGLGIVFIGLVPLLAAAAVRIMRGDAIAVWTTALLSLGVSQHYFLWLLHFGTVGASLSTAFLLPVTACVYRVMWLDRREPWLAVLLVLFTFFLLLWPPGALMCAPVALSLLVNGKLWTRRKLLFLALCGLTVLALYAKPLFVILGKGQSVMHYVMAEEDLTGRHSASLFTWDMATKGWVFLRNHVREAHPVLIFLGLAGCFFLPQRSIRKWFGPILLAFVLLTGWGHFVKPNLQLDRMGIPMFIVAVVPAAFMASWVLRTPGTAATLARAALLSLLFVGGYNVSLFYGNNWVARYNAMPPETTRLADWIRANTPEGGRVLYAGKTVHAYGRGHVAFLPILTGHEMMACDYYHFPPGYVEYNYPPPPFRAGHENFMRFMNLYNVTHIVTYHDHWKEFIRTAPEQFTEIPTNQVQTFDYLSVFEVERQPSMLLNATGTVRGTYNRMDITLEGASEEFVLKYNWLDGLAASDGVEVFPHDAGDAVRLIGIRPHGKTHITVRYPGWL